MTVRAPSTVPELQRLVARSERVRALGTGHSFNRLGDSPGEQVSVAGLPPRMDIDAERAAVTVSAGIRYGELAARLHAAGYALGNLASLPHISVAGACATATHGSGDRNGNLATAVSALEMVTAGGDIVTANRQTERFEAMVVALGTLGIVTALTLDIVPTFDLRQHVYEDLPLERFDSDLFAAAYSVSVFTDWTGPRFNQVWLKRSASDPSDEPPWPGARPASGPRHPISGMPVENCTEQLGIPGPWHERLPHFRPEFTPSSGDELQAEYLVPRQFAAAALAAVDGVRDRVARVLQVCEIRTVPADRLWLSPSYGRDSVAIHFTWINDAAAVFPVLELLEERLAPFDPRPHWGKLFVTEPAIIRDRYQRLPDFRRLLLEYDPAGKFGNELTDRYLRNNR